jgi:hypothetical protein
VLDVVVIDVTEVFVDEIARTLGGVLVIAATVGFLVACFVGFTLGLAAGLILGLTSFTFADFSSGLSSKGGSTCC